MDGSGSSPFPFLMVGAGPHRLALRALRSLDAPGPLLLHCRGIEVGRLEPRGRIAAGTILELPVARLPHVPLPAELRLSATPDGPDLAPPWPLAGAAAALTLLGPPSVRAEDLYLDHGMLRGTGREERNGLIEPVLYARINGATARAVSVDPPVGLPEGGCAFRFALPILPADLAEAGLTVELHMVGQDTPLGHFAWTRAGAGAQDRRLAELEARLRQMEEEQSVLQRDLQEKLRRQVAVQQERVNGFIAAAATLLLDRLATAPGAEQDALRGLLALTAPPQAAVPAGEASGRQVRVAPEDGVFGAGWHMEEVYPSGSFRWMSPRGLVLNPAPERLLAGVTLEVCHLYRADAPALTATLDDAAAAVEVEADEYGGFRVHIAPPAPRAVRLLRLVSLTGGSPSEDAGGTDRRVLSLAVSRVVFDYAG
ncbi:hypothetical protein [Paracraurococcus ruber]|uniref:Uncharacterized protein n=1 Tax=Paracraurococcus ruber TaxID=77675 RepID=A0ABS1D5X8_9PROT|nr:hypothetical protein [Paracraurococcus ruber]MBK1662295.1 hypothetical protein [Paracraurococcus ruber]